MSGVLRILLILVVSSIALATQARPLVYTPYQQTNINAAYNRLFCDDLDLYMNRQGKGLNNAWQVLFARPVDLTRLQTLADSPTNDSRLRLLAFHVMKQHKIRPTQKILLGIIVEVGQEQGLVTLAAYQDLHVRYISHTGKMKDVPKPDVEIATVVRKLFDESQPIIQQIGPWPKGRLPPPAAGVVRLSFLVSDGIYFGQGSMSKLARSPLAGPVLTAATELLIKLTGH